MDQTVVNFLQTGPVRSERQNETQKIEFQYKHYRCISLEIYIYLEKHQKNKKLTTEGYVAFFFIIVQ